jgi:hypothetical protein
MNRSEEFPRNEEQEEPILPTAEAEPQSPELLTEAGAEHGLEMQSEAIGAEEKRQPKESTHILKTLNGKIRGIIGGVLIGMSSLVAFGCNTSETTVPGPDNTPRTEQRVGDETQEKNKEYLGGIVEKMSGGEFEITDNDNLVVNIGGGHYYEVGKDKMDKLTDVAGTLRKTVESKNQFNTAFKKANKSLVESTIRIGIKKLGHELSSYQVSDHLKNLRTENSHLKTETNKAAEEDLAPENSKIPHSQKATSSEANEFLN